MGTIRHREALDAETVSPGAELATNCTSDGGDASGLSGAATISMQHAVTVWASGCAVTPARSAASE
jgi:hypothetical protein